jgi:predicted  nucleic acid-binding Zn-ribbon protein
LSEIEVAQLKISNKKTETALNESIELLKQQAEEKEQRLARYQEQVEVLTFEKEQAEKKLIDFKEQQGKINADW